MGSAGFVLSLSGGEFVAGGGRPGLGELVAAAKAGHDVFGPLPALRWGEYGVGGGVSKRGRQVVAAAVEGSGRGRRSRWCPGSPGRLPTAGSSVECPAGSAPVALVLRAAPWLERGRAGAAGGLLRQVEARRTPIPMAPGPAWAPMAGADPGDDGLLALRQQVAEVFGHAEGVVPLRAVHDAKAPLWARDPWWPARGGRGPCSGSSPWRAAEPPHRGL